MQDWYDCSSKHQVLLKFEVILGPNVVIGPNCIIGAGVRLSNTVIMGGASIKDYAWVNESIIGW